MSTINQNIIQTGPVSNKDLEAMNNHNGGIDQDAEQRRIEYILRKNPNLGLRDTGYEHSKYPGASHYQKIHQNDYNAAGQSFLEHTVYGLGQNIITAGTALGELVLSPIAAAAGLVTKNSAWDNFTTEIASKILDWSNEVMPNYQWENGAWYDNFGSSWQSFLQSMGYTEGFIGGTMLGGAALRGIGVLGKAASVGTSGAGLAQRILGNGVTKMLSGSVLSSYAEAEDQTYNDIKQWKEAHNKDLDSDYMRAVEAITQRYEQNKGKQLVRTPDGRVVDAAYLQYAEDARNIEQDLKEKRSLIDNKATEMGDRVFGSNMALLLATNMFEFGHLFAGGFRQAKRSFRALERNGQYKAAVGRIRAKAYGKGLANAVSEGFQEKAQGSFTTVAGNFYDQVLDRFDEGDDYESAKNTMSWMEDFLGGLHHAVTTTENMEDAVLGAMTALVGVPMITKGANRNASIGRNKFLGISGGLYGEIREAREQIQNAREGVEALNNFRANQDKASLALRNVIRMDKYSKDAMEAAMLNDKFGYENADVMATMTLINAFDNAGKLQELKDHVKGLENATDEDIQNIIDLTTKKIQDENGKDIEVGPYINQATDGSSVRMTVDEAREALNHRAETINQFIDDYSELKRSLDKNSNEELSNSQLETITWMYGQLQNFNRRSQQINRELSEKNVIDDAIVWLESENRPEEAQQVSLLKLDRMASIKLADFEPGYLVLEDYVKNDPINPVDPGTLQSIHDAQRILKAFKTLNDLYTDFLKGGEKAKKKLKPKDTVNQVREHLSTLHKRRKQRAARNATNPIEFEEATAGWTEEEMEEFLRGNPEHKKNKIFLKNAENLRSQLEKVIDNTIGIEESGSDATARRVLEDHIKNSALEDNPVDSLKTRPEVPEDEIADKAIEEAFKAAYSGRSKKSSRNPSSNPKSSNQNPNQNPTQNPRNPQQNPQSPEQEEPEQNPEQKPPKGRYNAQDKEESDNAFTNVKNHNIKEIPEDFYKGKNVTKQSTDVGDSYNDNDWGNFVDWDNIPLRIGKRQIIDAKLLNNSERASDYINNHILSREIIDTKSTLFKNIISAYALGYETRKDAVNALSIQFKGNTTESVASKNFWTNVDNIKKYLSKITNEEFNKLKTAYLQKNTEREDLLHDTYYEEGKTKEYYENSINEFTLDGMRRTDNIEDLQNSYEDWLHKKLQDDPKYKAPKPEDKKKEFNKIVILSKFLKDKGAWENVKRLKAGESKVRIAIIQEFEDRLVGEDVFEGPTLFFVDENDNIVGSVRHSAINNYSSDSKKTESHNSLNLLEKNAIKQYNEYINSNPSNKPQVYYFQAVTKNSNGETVSGALELPVTQVNPGFFTFGAEEKSLSTLLGDKFDSKNVYIKTFAGFVNKENRSIEKLGVTINNDNYKTGQSVYALKRENGSIVILPLRTQEVGNDIDPKNGLTKTPGTAAYKFREAVKDLVDLCLSLNNDFIGKQVTSTQLFKGVDTQGYASQVRKVIDRINSYIYIGSYKDPFKHRKDCLTIGDPFFDSPHGDPEDLYRIIYRKKNGGIESRSFFDEIRKHFLPNEQNLPGNDRESIKERVADAICETILKDRGNSLKYNITPISLNDSSNAIANHITSNLESTEEHNVSFRTGIVNFDKEGNVEIKTSASVTNSEVQSAVNSFTDNTIATSTSEPVSANRNQEEQQDVNSVHFDNFSYDEEDSIQSFSQENNEPTNNTDGDLPFRLVDTEQVNNPEIERPLFDKEKEKQWFDNAFPSLSDNEKLLFKDGLIEVMKQGKTAWGMYHNGIITLSNSAARGTLYHEAFHAVMDLQLNNEHKQVILEEAKSLYGDLSARELEEKLAEDFRLYMEDRNYSSFPQRILRFFKQLLQKITHWHSVNSHINNLFKAVNNGEENVKLLDDTFRKSKKFNELSMADRRDLQERGWTEEEFNSLTLEEQEFAIYCN